MHKSSIGRSRDRHHRAGTLSLVLLVGTLAWGAASGPPAEAHALLRRSVPERGAVLRRAPDAVTLTFTEPPEPTFSVIHVLDPSGRRVETGAAQAVPGQPLGLRVPLDGLPDGVYTVIWRTVSRTDGHIAGGAFEFGIGTVAAGSLAENTNPRPSAVYVVSRLLLYAGVIGLMGMALARAPAGPQQQAGLPPSLWGFWALAAIGVALLGLGQAFDTGAGLRLLGTPLGRALWGRTVPVAAAGLAIAIAQRSPRYRRRALVVLSGLATLTMMAHVVAGHAAAGSGLRQWLAVLEQWVHFASIGVWAGALLALLAAAGVAPGDAATARLCSLGAAGALGTAAVTGALRALEEVGSWSGLFSTEFGRLVAVKTGLFLVLALLGARTRRLVLSASARGPHRLQRVVGAEVTVATVILAVTALMTGLAPPAATPPEQGRTIQIPGKAPIYTVALSGGRTLTISLDPGSPGLNALHATFADASGRELDIARAPEIALGRAGEAPKAIAVLQEGPGHFYSDVELDRGDWQLSLAAITRAGETLSAHLSIHL